jgi:hypothetical protein
LIISQTAARRAGIDVSGFPRHVLTVRNRTEPVAIRAIEDLESLTMMSEHFARQGSNKAALKSVMQY